MQIRRKRTPRLQAVAAQFLLGIAGLALITFVCFLVGFGVARTAFAYVILIALVSLLGSFSTSVVLSIIAVACLNYFFVPPLFEFRVDDPDDIERMAVFLTTSLVVTALVTKVRASEARSAPSWITRLTPSFYLTKIGPFSTSTARPAMLWATGGKN
jgi:K+-sensing histidine kinase KdpD